jgi:hypothetical protein
MYPGLDNWITGHDDPYFTDLADDEPPVDKDGNPIPLARFYSTAPWDLDAPASPVGGA